MSLLLKIEGAEKILLKKILLCWVRFSDAIGFSQCLSYPALAAHDWRGSVWGKPPWFLITHKPQQGGKRHWWQRLWKGTAKGRLEDTKGG